MACGDRLRYLAVTASGLNLANPYDDVPLFSDYEEWLELARRLVLLSQTFHDALGVVEGERTPDSFPLWNEVNELHSVMVEKFADLPDFFSSNIAVDIGRAQSVIFDALCVIEMSESGIIELGGTAPQVPGAPPPRDNDGIGTATKNTITTLLLVGGGVAALVLLSRTRRR